MLVKSPNAAVSAPFHSSDSSDSNLGCIVSQNFAPDTGEVSSSEDDGYSLRSWLLGCPNGSSGYPCLSEGIATAKVNAHADVLRAVYGEARTVAHRLRLPRFTLAEPFYDTGTRRVKAGCYGIDRVIAATMYYNCHYNIDVGLGPYVTALAYTILQRALRRGVTLELMGVKLRLDESCLAAGDVCMRKGERCFVLFVGCCSLARKFYMQDHDRVRSLWEQRCVDGMADQAAVRNYVTRDNKLYEVHSVFNYLLRYVDDPSLPPQYLFRMLDALEFSILSAIDWVVMHSCV